MDVKLLLVPRLEKHIGIEVYATHSPGIRGAIRRSVEDFAVEEVLVDGSKASINETAGTGPLGSSFAENRFLLCVLVKRNWDTISAVKAVADQLRIGMNRIQFAGLKDTRAVTAQHITIEGVAADETERVHIKDLEINPVGYLRTELSTYYLLGNSFRITVGGINHPKPTLRKRILQTIDELEQIGGLPNFFGHQRFGTTRPITHHVGKAIIKGNFKKATMLFLAKSSPNEHPASRQAREALHATRNFRQALQDYPKQLRYERLMLRHLVGKPHDYVGAFRRLPLRLLELFPQAYQSYLFNRFLSRRLIRGLTLNKAEVGDYAMNTEHSGLPILTMHKVVGSENITEINNAIQAGKMRLAIPLFGYKQKHQVGVQEEIGKRIFEEEDVSPNSFKINPMPEISLTGKLRTATTPLNGFSVNEVTADPVDPSKHKVNMSFALHRGSYATVVLRELMKPRNIVKAGF
jgi:tRNA pseudouridine13 synthase